MSRAAVSAPAARAADALRPGADRPAGPARLLVQGALPMLALVPLCLIALAADERTLNGVSVWAKPLKFQLSVALHLLTLAVLLRCVAPAWAKGRAMRPLALALVGAGLFEIAYITAKAAAGEASHFNVDDPFHAAMYSLMGVGAVTLVAGAAVIGWLILRRPADGLGPGLRLGAGWGLILGAGATLIVAGYLSSQGGHWVGAPGADVPPTDAGGRPIVGWSREVGDLRAPHFFATHMMQVLPLVGWAADRLAPRRARPHIIALAAATGLALVAGTFAQALAGAPFLGRL
ncbi:MAG: hypothetical protein RIB45_05865 [Marivibrio sp.]|uniref:hypothetical protein n=1 Tax=Marivibrio sp. TaxID=2039719 RepID=UPI0032EAE13A